MHKSTGPRFNVALLEDDMARKGWVTVDLARKAGVSHMTAGRFLKGETQTARTAKKLARALGHTVAHYLIPSSGPAISDSGSETVSPSPKELQGGR